MALDFTESDAIVAASPGADVDADFFTENKANIQSAAATANLATIVMAGIDDRIYADNAAAISGGLVAGDIYRTSAGVLMVVFTP
jgi:hypothetical protein